MDTDLRLATGSDLRRWYYFAVLAEEMNFTRAASRLYVSQPALSQQMRAFETDLGSSLLDRQGPSFELTEAGRIAAREARELLEHAQVARQRVNAAARGETGKLRVAYTRSASGSLAGDLVNAYRRHYPEVTIELETGWTSRNIARVEAGEIDIGFVRGPVTSNTPVVSRFVGDEELLIALPEAHLLGEYESLSREQVADEPVVFWPRENAPTYYDEIVQQIWPVHPPNVVQEEPDDEQLMRAVAGGVGIGALPEHRARMLRTHGVVFRGFAGPVPVVRLGVAYRADSKSRIVQNFLTLVAESCSDHP